MAAKREGAFGVLAYIPQVDDYFLPCIAQANRRKPLNWGILVNESWDDEGGSLILRNPLSNRVQNLRVASAKAFGRLKIDPYQKSLFKVIAYISNSHFGKLAVHPEPVEG